MKEPVWEPWEKLPVGADAVFTSGDGQACIIYVNECANKGNGSFEIKYIEPEEVMEIYNEVKDEDGDIVDMFIEGLNESGRNFYCDNDPNHPYMKEEFDEWVEEFPKADFIFGRDGGSEEEMDFLVDWATKRTRG